MASKRRARDTRFKGGTTTNNILEPFRLLHRALRKGLGFDCLNIGATSVTETVPIDLIGTTTKNENNSASSINSSVKSSSTSHSGSEARRLIVNACGAPLSMSECNITTNNNLPKPVVASINLVPTTTLSRLRNSSPSILQVNFPHRASSNLRLGKSTLTCNPERIGMGVTT